MNYSLYNEIPLGTILSVPKGIIKHVGILANDHYGGSYTVISSSGKLGKVIEEPIEKFSNGQVITVEGYPSNLPSWKVVNNARNSLDTPYNLFHHNCEHFVRKIHGIKIKSPQLIICSIMAMLVMIYLFLRD